MRSTIRMAAALSALLAIASPAAAQSIAERAAPATDTARATYDQMPSGQGPRGTARAGRVWIVGADGKPQAVTLQLGITDGTQTEVLRGDLKEGQEVIVAVTGSSQAPRAAPASSQGQGTAPRPRF